jgi:hypothetical protein
MVAKELPISRGRSAMTDRLPLRACMYAPGKILAPTELEAIFRE